MTDEPRPPADVLNTLEDKRHFWLAVAGVINDLPPDLGHPPTADWIEEFRRTRGERIQPHAGADSGILTQVFEAVRDELQRTNLEDYADSLASYYAGIRDDPGR